MKIKLTTEVDGNYIDVMERFDRKLFEALKPKFGEMQIEEFTGSKKGDVVSLSFISPFKAKWMSEIVEDGCDEQRVYFIDEGRSLPFPFSFWRHKHIVKKLSESRSLIIDDITFQGNNILFSWFLYPVLYFAFYPRKRVYKRYFREK
jgi:ligand-binding SRPBCC domain-containing protein